MSEKIVGSGIPPDQGCASDSPITREIIDEILIFREEKTCKQRANAGTSGPNVKDCLAGKFGDVYTLVTSS